MGDRLSQLAEKWPMDIPFERAVRQQFAELDALVRHGVTWASISAALTMAGVRKKNGAPLSARQMNTVFLRSAKKARRPEPRVRRATFEAPRSNPFAASAHCAAILTPMAAEDEHLKIVTQPGGNGQTGSSELQQRLAEARRYRQSRKSDFDD